MASTNTSHCGWQRILLAALTLAFTTLFAHASTTETRDLSGFTAVKMLAAGNVSVNEGANFEVTVTGPAELLDSVKTQVRNKTLDIAIDNNGSGNKNIDDLHIDVTMPRIDGIHLTGAGDIAVGPLVTVDLSVSITGSGDIVMESVTAQNLSVAIKGSGDIDIAQVEAINSAATISGSGDIGVSGEVKNQQINIAGSGSFDGANLSAKNVRGSIMGSGDIEMGRAERRDIRKTGSGRVSFSSDGETLSSLSRDHYLFALPEGRRLLR
ncbi:head GIN domain-containing protein [Exilibacterium tricleocarpae]|nr:head GIN domain-containing protein [Exilibacterium tricleocarpae]